VLQMLAEGKALASIRAGDPTTDVALLYTALLPCAPCAADCLATIARPATRVMVAASMLPALNLFAVFMI
jgi:hypothetical protein